MATDCSACTVAPQSIPSLRPSPSLSPKRKGWHEVLAQVSGWLELRALWLPSCRQVPSRYLRVVRAAVGSVAKGRAWSGRKPALKLSEFENFENGAFEDQAFRKFMQPSVKLLQLSYSKTTEI